MNPSSNERRTGAIIWLTGLPCAGKSTLSRALADVVARSHAVEVLDGDVVRRALSPELGFSPADRDLNVRRVSFLARRLAYHGVVVIVAVVSPYAAARAEARTCAVADGVPFVEVFVTAPLDTLVARDVKGMYRKALAGEITGFTGVSDPYETPANPDITVQTDAESVDVSVRRILDLLKSKALL